MPKNVPWPPSSSGGLAGGHFMRSRGFRSKAVWLLEDEVAALEQFCRDHRRAPPPEAQGLAGRTGMTYQGLMRGVLVTYLKAKGYLPRNYRPDPQGSSPAKPARR